MSEGLPEGGSESWGDQVPAPDLVLWVCFERLVKHWWFFNARSETLRWPVRR